MDMNKRYLLEVLFYFLLCCCTGSAYDFLLDDHGKQSFGAITERISGYWNAIQWCSILLYMPIYHGPSLEIFTHASPQDFNRVFVSFLSKSPPNLKPLLYIYARHVFLSWTLFMRTVSADLKARLTELDSLSSAGLATEAELVKLKLDPIGEEFLWLAVMGWLNDVLYVLRENPIQRDAIDLRNLIIKDFLKRSDKYLYGVKRRPLRVYLLFIITYSIGILTVVNHPYDTYVSKYFPILDSILFLVLLYGSHLFFDYITNSDYDSFQSFQMALNRYDARVFEDLVAKGNLAELRVHFALNPELDLLVPCTWELY